MHFVKKRLEIIFPKIWIPYCLVNYAQPQAASLPLFRHRQQWPTPAHPCFWQQPSIGIFEIHFDMEYICLQFLSTFLPSQMIPSESWLQWALTTPGGDCQGPKRWSYCKQGLALNNFPLSTWTSQTSKTRGKEDRASVKEDRQRSSRV